MKAVLRCGRAALAGMVVTCAVSGVPDLAAQHVGGDVAGPGAAGAGATTLVRPVAMTLPWFEDGDGPAAGWQAAAPRRQTWRYARIGAIAGGAAGLVVGGWMALYCSSTAEGGCFLALPAFTFLGAASGFAAGAIIGATVPASGSVPAERSIGSGGIGVGAANATIGFEDGTTQQRGGSALRANAWAELRPWLALGPEVGIGSFGDAGNVRHIAVATRLSPGRGRVVPFATANLGAYDSTGPSLEYLGGGIGAGARLRTADGRFYVDVEARHSRNAQNIDPMRMNSLTVAGGIYW
jgi:hypothetical protein